MSSEERKKILQMVQDGKISAEQAASLMRALDADADPQGAEAELEVIEAGPGSGDERNDASEFEEVKSRARRFAMIPLWIGVFIAVMSAWGIYSVQQSAGVNFWFFCLLVPLLLGVLLIVLGKYIHGMEKTNVDEIIQILDATGKSGAPLIINANDNEDGEHVQVYIG
jgi:SHOCT-like protein